MASSNEGAPSSGQLVMDTAPNINSATTSENTSPHRSRGNSFHRHHRQSPVVHKKKKVPRRNSGQSRNPPHHRRGSPKLSPIPSPQQLHGKMWIRPLSARRCASPYRPVLASGAPLVVEEQRVDFYPRSDGWIRHVGASSTGYDDEHMLMCASPSSSVASFQWRQGRTSLKSARVTFGANGKPIKPRVAF